MQTTPYAGSAPASAREAPPTSRRDDPARTRVARSILLQAALLGLAADLLLRDGFTGVGISLWLLLLALSAVALVWRADRRVPRETGAWLLLATLMGAAMTWRAADALQFFDFVAALFSLGMAAISLADARVALFAARMRDTVWAGARVIGSIAIGVVPLVFRDAAIPVADVEMRGRARPIVRALLIALPLLVVFGSLLRGADPVFASIIAFPDIDFGELASHVLVIGFFTWVVSGWARASLLRGSATLSAPEILPFSLNRLDITAALGTLNVLFALYVITQLGWFFGGEAFLQARTGLTAAEYARQGFFQMVWVVLLVVPLLLVTRATLRPGHDLERRHTTLALPLIGLLGVMIVSAMLRMRLYVHYFGLTLERFYPMVFMGWLAIVLAWMALTVLRKRGRLFAAGAVTAALVILVLLNLAVPDVLVARVNVVRAQEPVQTSEPALDLAHLATLGGEAVPLAVSALLTSRSAGADSAALAQSRDRCLAARLLLRRWGPSSRLVARREASDAPWRTWNAGVAGATRVVQDAYRPLLAVQHDACPRARASGATVPAGR